MTSFSSLVTKNTKSDKNITESQSQEITISEPNREKVLSYRYSLIFKDPEEFMLQYSKLENNWLKNSIFNEKIKLLDGLVDAGVGIEVATELHAERAAELDKVVALEMLRAVEGHVLEEVSQAALALLLLDGAHTLCNVEVGHMLRPLVVADVVGEAVVKLADAHILVNGDGRHGFLCHHRSDGRQQE